MSDCILDKWLSRLDGDLLSKAQKVFKIQASASEVRAKRVKELKDDTDWNEYTKNANYKQFDEYYGNLEKMIVEHTNPKVVTEVAGLMLQNMHDGTDITLTVGEYDYATHTVEIAAQPTAQEIEKTVDKNLMNGFLRLYEVTKENIDEKLTLFTPFAEANKAKSILAITEAVEKVKGTHAVTHELIHAGAVNFMRENPTHEATIRLNELYNEALANKDAIKRMAHSTDVYSSYWTTNVNEFVAEALSNPGLMYALSNIRTDKKERLSKGLFKDLLETLINMLGLSNKAKNNLLEFTLDGFVAIMEAQATKTPTPADPSSIEKLKEAKKMPLNGTIHLKDRESAEKDAVERLRNCL